MNNAPVQWRAADRPLQPVVGRRDQCKTQPERPYRNARVLRKSFRRLAVKVLVVGLRIPAVRVDDAVPVIGRRVDRV